MSTYEISKSSLLSLKAEILRKQQELSKTRTENETKIKNLKKNSPLDLKNKNVEQRERFDLSEEDEDLLKKSRSTLEAKARLYDKLVKTSVNLTDDEIEFNRRYLVRFDKKAKLSNLPPEELEDDVDRYPDSEEDSPPRNYEPPQNPDEEWVEYVDCLGRTRVCLKKDLDYLKSRDRELKSIVDEKQKARGESPIRQKSPELSERSPPKEQEVSEENELLSSDMRRELLRKQWEKEEEELRNKSNIHYQDILFNEARTHGVGYYAFSKDEEERFKQQEALKKLREETKEQQKKSQDLKLMREKQLKARIKAARDRKRARLGLPPEDDPEPVVEEEAPKEDPKEVENEKEKLKEEIRKKHIRPWDQGKEGVKEHYEYTQEEWVDKKRKERPSEFAPPSCYGKEKERGYRTTKKREYEETSKSLKFTTKKIKHKDSDDYKHCEMQMKPVPIVNEVHNSDNDDSDALLADYKIISQSDNRQGRGVEIAPPPTFDYYGPGPTHGKREKTPAQSMDDSIEAGLKYLREQVEKKQSSKKRSEDMFLF